MLYFSIILGAGVAAVYLVQRADVDCIGEKPERFRARKPAAARASAKPETLRPSQIAQFVGQ